MNKNNVFVSLVSCMLFGMQCAAQVTIEPIQQENIFAYQQSINQSEYRLKLLRSGLTCAGIGLSAAALYGLYQWSKPADVSTDIKQDFDSVAIDLAGIARRLETIAGRLEPHLPELAKSYAAAASASQATGIWKVPSTIGNWFLSVGSAASSQLAIFGAMFLTTQHALPKVFSTLDKVYYTFTYSWFVTHRTEITPAFEELERVAYMRDLDAFSTSQFKQEAFVFAFNHVLRECEKIIAFMHIQNNTFTTENILHARHMCAITKNFITIINSYEQLVGFADQVPQGHFSWQEFVKSFRDDLNRQGKSYAHNEEYILSRSAR